MLEVCLESVQRVFRVCLGCVYDVSGSGVPSRIVIRMCQGCVLMRLLLRWWCVRQHQAVLKIDILTHFDDVLELSLIV